MNRLLLMLAGSVAFLPISCASESLIETVRYKPPPGYECFGTPSFSGEELFSSSGPRWEYLYRGPLSSVTFQFDFVSLPVGKPKPAETREAIEAALIKRMVGPSISVSNLSTPTVLTHSKLPAVRVSGITFMQPDAPFRTLFTELRWIQIESNLVLIVRASSQRTNEFLLLTNSLATLDIDRERLLQMIKPEVFFPFAPLDIEFEDKPVIQLLGEFVGLVGSPPKRVSEADQLKAAQAIGRMGKREFDYLVELLPSVRADRFLCEAISHAFKVSPTNGTLCVPQLVSLLTGDEITAGYAVQCLRFIGEPSVSPLSKTLEDSDPVVRRRGAYALALLGPLAKDAIPGLEKIKNDPDEGVRNYVAFALNSIQRTTTESK